MKRRAFIFAGAGAALWPLTTRAQPAHLPRVGILAAGTPDPAPFLKEFRDGLRGFGYVEGRTVALEIRSAGSTDQVRLKAAAAELVRLPVDVIVAFQTPAVLAARDTTRDIPIVMSGAGDPLGMGLVNSLARPGGNITGMSSAMADLAGKNVEILRELLPKARVVGVLCNDTDPFYKPFLAAVQHGGGATGVEIRAGFAHGAADLDAAFVELGKPPTDAVIIQPSLGFQRPAALALASRMPASSPNRNFAEAGGLASYSGNLAAGWRRAAVFVDQILKGAKPADLPVQEPTTFELVINLKTAKTLGVTVPPTLLARADEVIE